MIGVAAHTTALKTLELFDEKAVELLSSRFFVEARGGGAIVEFKKDSGWEAIHVGPDDESTRSLVLTLRLFMLNKDPISLQNMDKLYRSLPLSDELTHEFTRRRNELNAFLDSDSRLAIAEDRQLSHREILDIFVYGAYAHVRPRYRQIFEDIRTTPFFPLFQSSLADAIVAFGRCVSALRQTNQRAIAELGQTRV